MKPTQIQPFSRSHRRRRRRPKNIDLSQKHVLKEEPTFYSSCFYRKCIHCPRITISRAYSRKQLHNMRHLPPHIYEEQMSRSACQLFKIRTVNIEYLIVSTTSNSCPFPFHCTTPFIRNIKIFFQ